VERAAPPSAERAGGRRRGAAGRARGCRPRRAGCAAAGRAPGRASVSSLLRRRRPKHAGGRPRRFLSCRRRPSVRIEPAAPPPAERAGGRPLRASRVADDRACRRAGICVDSATPPLAEHARVSVEAPSSSIFSLQLLLLA